MNIFECSENNNFLFEDPFLGCNVFNPERNQSIYDLFACQLENAGRMDRYDSFQQAIDDCVIQKPIELNSKLSDHAASDRSIDTKPTKESSKDTNQTKTQTYPQIFKVFKIQKHFRGQRLSKDIISLKNSTNNNFYKSNENYNESEESNYIINDNATSNANSKMTRFGRSQDKELFRDLRTICTQNDIIDISDFNVETEFLEAKLKKILLSFCNNIQWKGGYKNLHYRIRKLLNLPFSVRENKLLRKMFRRQCKEGKVNFKELIYHFPGKSIQRISEQITNLNIFCMCK